MFTPEERARLRSDLLDHASRDARISGAAITGSAAEEREDRWSDIDLAFGVAGREIEVVDLGEVRSPLRGYSNVEEVGSAIVTAVLDLAVI